MLGIISTSASKYCSCIFVYGIEPTKTTFSDNLLSLHSLCIFFNSGPTPTILHSYSKSFGIFFNASIKNLCPFLYIILPATKKITFLFFLTFFSIISFLSIAISETTSVWIFLRISLSLYLFSKNSFVSLFANII